ncbi:hypothetical protein [Zunongwangia sp. H14]|uniref:hypothetical protein n=1 Tax=Zunongwangia sp. H14 TaxID=3240792 RepID=UPI0035682309
MMKSLKVLFLFLLTTKQLSAQNQQSKAELEKEIIGSWHYENSSQDKIIYFEDGTVKRYHAEVLRSTGKYEIVKECDGEKLQHDNFFLKETDRDRGASVCVYIEAINFENNGIFSIMTRPQGKIVVLKKD